MNQAEGVRQKIRHLLKNHGSSELAFTNTLRAVEKEIAKRAALPAWQAKNNTKLSFRDSTLDRFVLALGRLGISVSRHDLLTSGPSDEDSHGFDPIAAHFAAAIEGNLNFLKDAFSDEGECFFYLHVLHHSGKVFKVVDILLRRVGGVVRFNFGQGFRERLKKDEPHLLKSKFPSYSGNVGFFGGNLCFFGISDDLPHYSPQILTLHGFDWSENWFTGAEFGTTEWERAPRPYIVSVIFQRVEKIRNEDLGTFMNPKLNSDMISWLSSETARYTLTSPIEFENWGSPVTPN